MYTQTIFGLLCHVGSGSSVAVPVRSTVGPVSSPLYLLPSIIRVPTFVEYFQTPVLCSDENICIRVRIEHWWNGTGRGNRSTCRESCPSATWTTTILKGPDRGSKPASAVIFTRHSTPYTENARHAQPLQIFSYFLMICWPITPRLIPLLILLHFNSALL